jgi:hypothetical protein
MSAAALSFEGNEFDRSDGTEWVTAFSGGYAVGKEIERAAFCLFVVKPTTFSNSLRDTLSAFLARELKGVEEVRSVSITLRVQNGRPVIHVWSTLSKDDRATRYRVYEVEERLMASFPGELFDFHLHPEG